MKCWILSESGKFSFTRHKMLHMKYTLLKA